MLKQLKIDQFVIIDSLDLDFAPGLTILTGETGAGKSILLDATGLILGEASSRESIRQGAERSVIEARFAPRADHPVWKVLREHGLADAGQHEFSVHRTVPVSGGETIRLNNKDVPLDLLQKIGTYLVEIHGQFANQSLLDPANQLRLLDLSGAFPQEVFTNVASALSDVHRYTRELEEENLFLASNKRELPRIEQIVGELENIGMKRGFVEEVEEHYAVLRRAKETSEAFQSILGQLIASNGIVMSLASVNNIFARQKNMDAQKTAKVGELLASALDNARNTVTELRRVAPEYEIDTGPLRQYEQILGVLNKVAKDAKITLADLTGYYEALSAKMNRIRNGRERVAEIDRLLADAKRAYLHHARILTEKRTAAGQALSAAITAEFAPLKLMRAEFMVKVEEKINLPWTDLGINEVTFTARMNPGMPFSPVAETASGGELARMILGLKVVLQRVQTTPTLIFDEVDTGIGGSAAAAVGERLAQLADTTQVLVITHSPQVAARGDQHMRVSKETDGITTTSQVRMLSNDERTDEISRMLAGDTITAESHAAAQSLIAEAHAAAGSRREKRSGT